MRTLLAASVVWSVLASSAGPQPPPAGAFDVRREVLLPRDMKTESIPPIRSSAGSGPGVVWSTRVPRTVAWGPSVRVHLNVVRADAAVPWRVIVKDSSGREVERLDGATLSAAKEWWTLEVPTPTATIELAIDAASAQTEIEIDKYAFRVDPAIPQAIVGVDNMRDITDPAVPPRVRTRGSPVARLRFMVADGEAVCTGFLVGRDLLMTNEHCINNDEQAKSALVEFGYDSEAASTSRYRVLRVEATDFALDYSLLRLSGEASQHRRLFLGASNAVADNARLYIIQHPGGKPKKAAFPPNCGVDGNQRPGRAATNTDFGHVCDTLGGSSGSPVLDWTTGSVVGLHHLGFRAGIDDPVNQAVHIREILTHLKGRVGAEVLKEITSPPQ